MVGPGLEGGCPIEKLHSVASYANTMWGVSKYTDALVYKLFNKVLL